MQNNHQSFEEYINSLWAQGMTSELISCLPLDKAFKDKRILAIYLSQVYHYAVHTPRHQAMVGVNPNNKNAKYMRYCFEHAQEETAHELMALKDIQSLGYNVTDENMPPRLPSTDLLIAFLYQEAQSDQPIHHLGYGFWSENACPFISEFMRNLMTSMDLKKEQMTFYAGHVTIDKDHARVVRKVINMVVKSEDDWKGMQRVAKVTFDLTLGIVKESFEAYNQLVAGKNEDFEIFR